MSLFFPDNAMRDKRYRELLADIERDLIGTRDAQLDFERELARTTATITQKFSHLKEVTTMTTLLPPSKDIPTDMPLFKVQLPLVVLNVVGSTSVFESVRRAVLVRLINNPATQEWAAMAFIGALSRGGAIKWGGAIGAAAIVSLVIEGASAAVFGAVTRDRLGIATRELLDPRVNALRERKIMSFAATGVTAIANTLDALPSGIPAADIVASIERAYARTKAQIDGMTIEHTVAELIQLDHLRGSYRVEDANLMQSDGLGFVNLGREQRALDVPMDSHAEAVQLIAYPWHGRPNQRWNVDLLSRENERGYRLRNQESSLLLNAAAPGGVANGVVIQWHDEDQDNSMWFIVPVPAQPEFAGYVHFFIVSKMTGQVLDVDDAGHVLTRPATGAASQVWGFKL